MANNKDFFDEEFEKKVADAQKPNDKHFDSWSSYPVQNETRVNKNKPLYITLICVALVLCLVLGWVLCTIFNGFGSIGKGNTGITPDEGGEILNTVIEYLKNNYYQDISDEEWLTAIEASGTALMQYAGDRYSQIMAPQTYYDFLYPSSSSSSSSGEIFGISFVVEEGVGLYISSVVANSSAYGVLKEGDIILKLSDMKQRDGSAPSIGGQTFDSFVTGQWTTATIQAVLNATYSATFLVLRMDEVDSDTNGVFSVQLQRSKVNSVDSNYDYSFIEFYFNDTYKNISGGKNVANNGKFTTYEERNLSQLPDDTGYVRILEFMDYSYSKGGKIVTVSAYDEFLEVMQLFKKLGLKRLVLDLKGNPGGNVQYVSQIASILITDSNLTNAEKSVVRRGNELLITTLVFPKENAKNTHYYQSSYDQYFGELKDTCSIVVWTDGGSASASELLTGALRDYGTAKQMGTTTYGKGIAQTWRELPFYGTVTDINGKQQKWPWAIYYTCASYYSPLGHNIHGVGYTPDDGYNGLTDYADLWKATLRYWK